MELQGGAVLLDFIEEDGIARITLNRPERRNAFNSAQNNGVGEALKLIEANDKIGCVITVGAGGVAFSSGNDLYEMRDRRDNPEKYKDQPSGAEENRNEALRLFSKPTLAIVDGFCLGGGLHFMCMHDIAIAADNAQLGLPEIIRGSYASAISLKLSTYIPLKKVFYLQQSGRYISGTEADQWGLVTKAVPQAELYDYSYALAKEIASHSHVALMYGKKVVYGVVEPQFKAGRDAAHIGQGMGREIDPIENLEGYLQSQKRRTGTYQPGTYVRPSGT